MNNETTPLVDYEAVSFDPPNEPEKSWRAVVVGYLQRPTFNSKGAALAFGQAVYEGKRKPEPVL